MAEVWEGFLDKVRKSGSSTGAVIEVVASGVPVGLGAPVYGKLDADIAAAMMGINAVKGVEIGAGFDVAVLSGEDNADEMRIGPEGSVCFLSNACSSIPSSNVASWIKRSAPVVVSSRSISTRVRLY